MIDQHNAASEPWAIREEGPESGQTAINVTSGNPTRPRWQRPVPLVRRSRTARTGS